MSDKKIPTIIVCLDTTNSSEVTLRYACYKAKRTGFAVEILAILESSYKGLLFVSEVVGKDKRKAIDKHLTSVIKKVSEETGVTPTTSIAEGDIVTEIVRAIKSNPDCTMLILGKSHNSLTDNTVLPKISKMIGNKIKVPIVIVPENLSDEYLKKLV